MTRDYSEAAVEVLDILDHTSEEKVSLIPTRFINYLKENAAKDYVAKIDYSKPINEINVKAETMGILGTICKSWWWNEEEKQEYARLVREKEFKQQEKQREKYNPDDIFKNKTKNDVSEQIHTQENATDMIEYKESIFTKFVNFIKSIFSKG